MIDRLKWVLALPLAVVALSGAPAKDPVVASAGVAVAQTGSGTVQGFTSNGINTFRGIPYAQAERFMPPTAAPGWQGTRTALSYGLICPQPVPPQINDMQNFISDTQYWPQSESCQNLNIWTPGLADGKKRPVMVWLHGGGFFSGSSHENAVYDGENLSRKGDVVVVSVNHRLNALGFMDLSAYGEQYRSSGNVGMMDIVAALKWVRDNIAAFGGDPANVTIFGQSGGGGKVATLLAAPSAQGLFGKAIIESGIGPDGRDGDQTLARRVAALTIQNAGLKPGDVGGLKALPYEQLAAAGAKALMDVSKEIAPGATGPLGFPRVNWGPVVDGAFLPEKPFAAAAPAVSRNVPLLIGSTLNEFALFPNPALRNRGSWGVAEATAYLKTQFGERAPAAAQAYQAAYPAMKPGDWPVIDTMFRAGALRAARMKAEQGAPTWNYLFAWQSPILDGAWAAGHSMELAFVFNNLERGRQSTGGGPRAAALTERVSQAWINFARSGDPSHPGLPKWPRYTANAGATMIFDDRSHVRVDHDAALFRLLAPTRP